MSASAARVPRVLSIAGSDPSGGAGIQADLKSIAANGGYGMAVITALTAQNTKGVYGVHTPPASFLRQQLDAVHDDVEIDAVKLGMLGDAEVIATVRAWLGAARPPVVVLDPVMVATSGGRLLDPAAEQALRELLPMADLVTPNLPELAVLADEPPVATWAAALEQALRVSARYHVAVLVKGGHLDGQASPDAVVDAQAEPPVVAVDGVRVATTNTHGTGCSLSSALATLYPRHRSWALALREAKSWLEAAIRAGSALDVGHGHGPIDHMVRIRERVPAPPETFASWWEEVAGVRDAIDALPFVSTLAAGTLDGDAFVRYLTQDALYLREYARVLARASQLAPVRDEQVFWARCTQNALAEELELHTTWLGGEPLDAVPSRQTRAYIDHLLAAGPDYGTVVAALLPCYWIYADLGVRLAHHSDPAHPYRVWLDTYAGEAMAAATQEAVRVAELALSRASTAERQRMRRAFRVSCEYELTFFEQVSG